MHQPLIERRHHISGVQRIYRFDNGFGASLIKTSYSSGGMAGLWELVVVVFNGPAADDYNVTIETPVTHRAEGWLNEDGIQKLLDKIAALPMAKKEKS